MCENRNKASSNRQTHLSPLLLPSLHPAATMADEDPRHEQIFFAISDGDDALVLSIDREGIDVTGVSGDSSRRER